ncbi:MAG: hypothetical protein ACR2M1_05300, partial [Gemmatimonadaceae bacterium]
MHAPSLNKPRQAQLVLPLIETLAASGQFVLGQPLNSRTKPMPNRLPTVAELYPETIDAKGDKNDDLPSCSALEASERQEPFVNQTLAFSALALLAGLFRYGRIPYHVALIDIAAGATGYRAVPIIR